MQKNTQSRPFIILEMDVGYLNFVCVIAEREKSYLDLDWPFISNCILAGFLLEYED